MNGRGFATRFKGSRFLELSSGRGADQTAMVNNNTIKAVHAMAVRKRIIYTPPRIGWARFQWQLARQTKQIFSARIKRQTCNKIQFKLYVRRIPHSSTETVEILPIPGLLRR